MEKLYTLVICFVVVCIHVPTTLSAMCEEFNTDGINKMVATTWVPDCTDAFEFCVKMDTTDGVADIFLSPTADLDEPYFWISLGSNADRDDAGGPGAGVDTPVSHISLCKDGGDCDTTSNSDENGDVNENGQTCFVLYTTSNDGGDAIHVRNAADSNSFISLNNLGDKSKFDPSIIRYVVLESHDGANAGTVAATWEICTDNWQSLAIGADIVVGGCLDGGDCEMRVNDGGINPDTTENQCMMFDTSTTSPAYIKIDLGEEKHVVGVTIYNAVTAVGVSDADLLQDFGVFVGSCVAATPTLAEIQMNVPCGVISDDEAAPGTPAASGPPPPIYKPCPTNTYGRYVFIADTIHAGSTLGSDEVSVCEVVVHGKTLAETDKTMIQFALPTYTVMETPVTSTQAVTLTRTRTVSPSTFTCDTVSIADITNNLGIGTATIGADYKFDSANTVGASYQVDFVTNEVTKTIDTTDGTDKLVEILADCVNELDETIVLELQNPRVGVRGTQKTTTITIEDDDPIYKFSTDTASVSENAEKVTLTVERSGITDVPTTIHVSTADCPGDVRDTDPIARVDSTFNDYVSVSEAITFLAGETSKTVDIFITDDDGNVDFIDEDFCVQFAKSVSNRGDIKTPSVVRVTISNDDTVYGLCDDGYQAYEYQEKIQIEICRFGKIDTPGCVDVSSKTASGDDLATVGANNDYPAFPRTPFRFNGYETRTYVDIQIYDDANVEEDEIFALEIKLPSTDCGSDLSPVISKDGGPAHPETDLTILDDDSLISVTSPTNQIPENGGSVTILFERTVTITEETITVNVNGATDTATNVGTSLATEALDFMKAGTHSVTFGVGETTAELVIPIIDDSLIELDETFSVEIIDADSDINQGRKRTDVTILNNDAYFYIDQIERRILESVEEFHIVIHRGPLVVNGVYIKPFLDNDIRITVETNSDEVSGATAVSDFVPVTKTVEFSGATQDAVETCVIRLVDDQLIEGPEQFFVMISNENVQIDPDRDEATITIEDDDGSVICSVDGEVQVSIEEGDDEPLTITCSRAGIDNGDGDDQGLNRAANIVLTARSESATQGQDFRTFTRSLTFPANVATITETIEDLIIDDAIPEIDETFRIDITATDSEVVGSGSSFSITIIDNDVERFGFEETEYTVGESCEELQVVIVRTSSSLGEGTVLRLTATNGAGSNGATYPNDYTTQEEIIQFLPNQVQQVVTIDVKSDNDDEGTETFTLSLSKISGSGVVDASVGTATVTIQDSIVTFSVQDAVITRDESSGTQPIVFVRSGDFCRTDEIYVSTRDNTARASQDYISFNNRRLVFPGNSNTASVDLTILDDNKEELTETFTVEIQNNNNIIIGSGTTTVSIQDDDGRVYFRVSEYSVVEGQGSATLTVNRVGNSVTASNVRIQTIGNGGTALAGSDYTPITNRFIEFDATETSKSFSVTILDDNIEEEDETFCVRIIDTTDGTVSDPSEACVTIIDDDEQRGGLTTGAIIGIAAGIAGGVLLLLIIGGLLCFSALRPRGGVPVGRAVPVPRGYNGPASYPQDFLYLQDYGQVPPRRVGPSYYR